MSQSRKDIVAYLCITSTIILLLLLLIIIIARTPTGSPCLTIVSERSVGLCEV